MNNLAGSHPPCDVKFAATAATFLQVLARKSTPLQSMTSLTVHKKAAIGPTPKTIDFFTTQEAPAISITQYILRCLRYARCGRECFVFALAYIRRAAKKGLAINNLTAHRMFITALVVAIKVREDCTYTMDYYARIGGLQTRDLVVMEMKFLMNVLDFRADVPIDEYFATCREITRAHVEASTGPQLRKGEFTSSDDDGSENGLSLTDYPLRSVAADCARVKELLAWSKECQVFVP